MLELKKICILVLTLLVAGCGGRQTEELLGSAMVSAPVTEIAGNHSIFIATTRKRSDDPSKVFDRERSATLNYARANVTVPGIHETGRIERRSRGKSNDPAKYFMASEVVGYDTAPKFSSALSTDIAARGGRVMVFVHGYNTGFDAAVYRVTQIAHDSGYPGTPVLFSWASGAKTRDYVYDRESASAARDQLEVTLRMLAQTGARRIDIVAHSLGTWVTMEALRQLAINGDRDLGGKLGDVVLASPDIDVDVFKSQMRRYGKPNKPFILLLSDDDRALRLSGLIAGSRPRVGDYKDAADLADYGVSVVDLSSVKGSDRFNHTKFADNPELVKMIGQRLREDDGFASDREVTDRISLLGQ
ncbi:MAG: alpha/beta fold hydrolase [Mesorhizobium sp.]|nr:MAG: alpha/beta fold hydrolase [Mesorhizobium sp.]TIU91815.1 MAG: alpha/beta fold hydrolase [Mesorhizobium sp.]TKD46203.1 MAG: alpha/beta fold hydrolase [Mesorhizobium sp.]